MTTPDPTNLKEFHDWFITAVMNLRRVNPEEYTRLMADLDALNAPCTWELLDQARDRLLDSYMRENLMLEAQLEGLRL